MKPDQVLKSASVLRRIQEASLEMATANHASAEGIVLGVVCHGEPANSGELPKFDAAVRSAVSAYWLATLAILRTEAESLGVTISDADWSAGILAAEQRANAKAIAKQKQASVPGASPVH